MLEIVAFERLGDHKGVSQVGLVNVLSKQLLNSKLQFGEEILLAELEEVDQVI